MTRLVLLAALALTLALLGCPREPRLPPPSVKPVLAQLDRADRWIWPLALERCRIHAQGRCLP